MFEASQSGKERKKGRKEGRVSPTCWQLNVIRFVAQTVTTTEVNKKRLINDTLSVSVYDLWRGQQLSSSEMDIL